MLSSASDTISFQGWYFKGMCEDEGLYHNGLVIMTMIEYILKEKFLQIDLSWHPKGQLIVYSP